MMAFAAGRRGARLPSFLMMALALLVLFLSFNCWDVSKERGRLLDELAEAQEQVKRTDAARSRLEKRNSELTVQEEAQRREMERKDGDYDTLRGSLQALEVKMKKCSEDKMKMESVSLSQGSEIQRLKEQLVELKNEFMRREDQLLRLKKNSTLLEKKLEYESSRCKQQINQLNEVHAEKQRILEEEAARLRKLKVEGEPPKLPENLPTAPEFKELGGNAGVPAVDKHDVRQLKDASFMLKKPAIAQKEVQHADMALAKRAAPGEGPGRDQEHADALGSKVLPLKLETKMESVPEGADMGANNVPPEQGPDDSKVGMNAGVLVGHQGQLAAPDAVKVVADKGAGLQVAPNPAQVLVKPMEKEPAKNHLPDQIQNAAVGVKRHQAMDGL